MKNLPSWPPHAESKALNPRDPAPSLFHICVPALHTFNKFHLQCEWVYKNQSMAIVNNACVKTDAKPILITDPEKNKKHLMELLWMTSLKTWASSACVSVNRAAGLAIFANLLLTFAISSPSPASILEQFLEHIWLEQWITYKITRTRAKQHVALCRNGSADWEVTKLACNYLPKHSDSASTKP